MTIYYVDERDTLKRFIICAYNPYYPSGGFSDIKYDTSSIETAIKTVAKLRDRFEIVELYDLEKGLTEIDINKTKGDVK